MYLGRLWIKVFEWWAGQSPTVRYGIGLAFLGISAIIYLISRQIWISGIATGVVLLIAALLIRDVD